MLKTTDKKMNNNIDPTDISNKFSECQNVCKKFNSTFSSMPEFENLKNFVNVNTLQLTMSMNGYYLLKNDQVDKMKRCLNKFNKKNNLAIEYPEVENNKPSLKP